MNRTFGMNISQNGKLGWRQEPVDKTAGRPCGRDSVGSVILSVGTILYKF